MKSLRAVKTFLVCAALSVVSHGAPGGAAAELRVPGRGNAYASIAASERFVAIAWGATASGSGTDVYVATSRDAGVTFGRPARVNDAASQASLAGEQPPRVSLVERHGERPDIVVVWTAKAPSGTRLLSAKSLDGGASFSRPVSLPGSEGTGNRGWHATAAASDGRTFAIWLDHREQAPRGAGAVAGDHAGHKEHHGDGVARAQLSKLFFAPLGASSAAVSITGGVCYCCKTAIAVGADGSIHAAWRHVYPGNVRDIASSVSHDGGRTFTPPSRVSDDQWVLDGCPENGPAMAVDPKGRVYVVWPTLVSSPAAGREPTLALFLATSTDGVHFTPRQPIPTEGLPRHPQIAVEPSGEIFVVWDEQGGGSRRIAIGRGTPDEAGAVRFRRQILSEGSSASYPVVAVTADAVVAAWTGGTPEAATIRVERLPN